MSSISQSSHTLQSQQSRLTSSVNTALAQYCRLSSKDIQRLQDIFEKLSKYIIEKRGRKIQLLQKYNHVLNKRVQVQRQLKRLENLQLKKITQERDRQQIIMLQLLTKRQKMRQMLRESTEHYQKKQKRSQKADQMKKGQLYLMLIQERIRKEQELQKLQSESRHQLLQKDKFSYENLSHEIQKETGLSGMSKLTKSQQVKLSKDMRCQYIHTLTSKIKNKGQRQEIESLLSQMKYPEYSYNELTQYMQEEQKQKQALFNDLKAMKSGFTKIQKENNKLERILSIQ